MVLTVKDRIILLNILPSEGDILTLRIVRKIQEDLGFTESDHAIYKFKTEGPVVHWDETVPQEKEIEIKPKAHSLISDALKELNAQKKLRMEHMDLYEKFVTED